MQNQQVSKTIKPLQFSKNCTIGIDLGGTKVSAALVDAHGHIVHETKRPTVPPGMSEFDPKKSTKAPGASDVRKHVAYVVSAMTEAALECAEQLKSPKLLRGIGLASAGPMNIDEGTLLYPANFRGWKKVALVNELEKSLKAQGLRSKVGFQNDAMAAALAEGWIGAAKGCQTFAVITVGTGIGTGVIFNGRPAQSRGMGSEWGHIISNSPGFSTDPLSFREREVEGLASGTGLVKRAQVQGLQFGSVRELAAAAKAGDQDAKALFQTSSEALASLFYSLSLGFHPEMFALSGGMISVRELFLPQAVSIYKTAMKANNPKFLAPVRLAKLGTYSGVIGAARLPHL